MQPLSQGPVRPGVDLRTMLREHLVGRALACMGQAAARRRGARATGSIGEYARAVRASVRSLYGRLPVGADAVPVRAVPVGASAHRGCRVENLLFESFPGWQVNATAYVPLDFAPPYAAVVVPVGHSGKQFADYQLPCQLFARAGYLAVTFDPPGQAGGKQPGNDHFRDGVAVWDSPIGFRSLLEAEDCTWPADAFLPKADLTAAAAAYGPQARVARAEWPAVVGWIQTLLEGEVRNGAPPIRHPLGGGKPKVNQTNWSGQWWGRRNGALWCNRPCLHDPWAAREKGRTNDPTGTTRGHSAWPAGGPAAWAFLQ